MITLALESSAITASVALDKNGVITEEFLNSGLTHSSTLMPLVEKLLKKTDTVPEDIDIFAVASGPGSFTGIRIGIASVKGMAMGVGGGKNAVGVSTLEAMAACFSGCGKKVCALMDARCGQFYNAVFDCSSTRLRLTNDRALPGQAIFEELSAYQEPVLLVGDGARKFAETFAGNFLIPDGDEVFQHARGVALLARETEPIEAEMLLPEYLRLPQAERELRKKQEIERNE